MRCLALVLAAGCTGQVGTVGSTSQHPTSTSGTVGGPATTSGAGGSGAGGSGTSGSGSGGSSIGGGGGAFLPPPSCDAGPGASRPSLTAGVWTAINPQGQLFTGDPG